MRDASLIIGTNSSSPLVLDLDKDGVETTSLQEGVHFDLNANGFAEQTAWISSDDGLLVLDRNLNGFIDNGTELFGNYTRIGTGKNATNGFLALTDIDSNDDRKIDVKDASFSQLKVWKDLDSDGKSTANELFSLNEFGITSIGVSYVESNFIDSNLNEHKQVGFYTSQEGESSIVDVWFHNNSLASWTAPRYDVALEMSALPDLPGFGNLPALKEAIFLDSTGTLRTLVSEFSTLDTMAEAREKFEKIIFEWTHSDAIDVSSVNFIDARRLHSLEQFIGEDYYNRTRNNEDVYINIASKLNDAYNVIFDALFNSFMSQTVFKPIYDGISYAWNASEGRMDLNVDNALKFLQEKYFHDPDSMLNYLREFTVNAKKTGEFSTEIWLSLRSAGDISSDGLKYHLAGMGFENVVVGTQGSDSLTDPTAVSTLIYGGAGNDTITDSGGSDTIDGGDGDDTITDEGSSVTNLLRGGAGNDTIRFTSAGNSTVEGGDGDDVLKTVGSSSSKYYSNILNGGRGNDNITSAASADTYLFNRGDGGDTISENGNTGDNSTTTDRVVFGAGIAQSDLAVSRSGDALVIQINDPSGVAGGDQITVQNWYQDVNAQIEQLVFADGGSMTAARLTALGNAVILGTAGNDTIVATADVISVDGLAGNDTLSGSTANDKLIGGAGDDSLTGNDGNDTLDGGIGRDTLVGGLGDDLYIVDLSTDVVTEAVNAGTDKVNTTLASYTLGVNVEALDYTGVGPFTGSGNALNNSIKGGVGNDTLNGGAGSDTLAGLAGDDTYIVDVATDVVTELAGAGVDLVNVAFAAAGTYVLGASVENATVTAAAAVAVGVTGNELANVLIGNGAANTLTGNDGNDTLDGGLGADTLVGGLGDDVYVVDVSTDVVTEAANAGIDQVNTALASYTLGANVEKLSYTAAAAFTGNGNALGNDIKGGAGNDTLSGLAGNDTLIGGAGTDSLLGGDGDDLLLAGAGTADVADGGLGVDTLVLVGNFADYVRSRTTAMDTKLVNAMTGEAVTLRNVEQVRFADGVKTLAAVNDNLVSVGNDVLTGTTGNDTLDGGTGSDTLVGLAGDDTYVVDVAGDVVTESAGEGIDVVNVAFTAAATYVLGANVENATVTAAATVAASVTGNELANVLIGNGAANTLTGNDGNDTLDGGLGADTLVGGLGEDVYVVDVSTDVVTEAVNAGIDQVNTALASYTLGANVEKLSYTAAAAFTGNGNALDNDIKGGAGNDTLSGLAGNDTLTGGAGADSLLGGDGDDLLLAGTGTADVADGGLGADTLVLAGNFADYVRTRPTATDTKLVNATTGEAVTLRNVEQVRFADGVKTLADVNYNLTSPGADVLTGTAGNDTLDGGAGSDTLVGLAGDDTYIVDVATDVVTEAAGAGVDLVNVAFAAAGTYVLGANVENATVTAAASVAASVTGNELANVLFGNGAANTLTGNDGNDTLDGGAGADTLVGGLGDDVYVVDVSTDVVTEAVNAGIDQVNTALASYTLGANLEKLGYTAAGAFTGNGNALGNDIKGGAGNDSLLGGDGDDLLLAGTGTADVADGGLGVDTLVLAGNFTDYVRTRTTVTDTKLVNTTTGEAVTLRNVEQAQFADGVKTLADVNYNLTSPGGDVLTGTAGNDTLDGGAGSDTLVGLAGDDTYIVDVATDVVTELAGDGVDLVNVAFAAAGTYVLGANVENATVTAAAAVAASVTGNELANVLIGNGAANTLTGNDGNDTLDGGLGADTLVGGLGDDVYVVDVSTDVVTEAANGGSDQIRSSITYTLATNVESLSLTGSAAVNATGNAGNNLLTGNGANNTLNGAAGNDILQGGAGVDVLTDTSGANLFDGGVGNDSMTGGAGSELFIGGGGNDTITTSTGADIVVFNRGDGADTILASTVKDNTISVGNAIHYADLLFSKNSNDLVLSFGASDQLTLKDWYLSTSNHSVANLQMVLDGGSDYDALSPDALKNKKVEQFDFDGLAGAFDQARAANPALVSWALSSSLLNFHLAGSDTAAIGGDLAYQYGVNGTLSGITMGAAQAVLATPSFGAGAQSLQAGAAVPDQTVRLM